MPTWELRHFKGIPVYVQPAHLADGESGAIAPPNHITDGELNERMFDEPSFAHMYANGEIRRFGKVIGHKSDLIP